MKIATSYAMTACLLLSAIVVQARPGTEGAAFLDIPVGAGPAALGAAYSASANDAYAATWNPGGLGFLESTEFSGQHLSYLDSLHYEYLSFAVPFRKAGALGGSVQYLGTGDVDGLDGDGNSIGSISGHYASYNLAYGRRLTDRLSLGATGKFIHAKLVDHSASAYAMDLGSMYNVHRHVMLAATVTNIGSKLEFLNEGDSLPLAFHLAASYQPTAHWLITTEGVYPQTGLASFHLGSEWHPLRLLAIRAGYRTDTLKGLSALAGMSTGLGLKVLGQELAYAWLPYGDLGNTHYFSLQLKFREAERTGRNLIQYQSIKSPGTASAGATESDYPQLMELLTERTDPLVHSQQKEKAP